MDEWRRGCSRHHTEHAADQECCWKSYTEGRRRRKLHPSTKTSKQTLQLPYYIPLSKPLPIRTCKYSSLLSLLLLFFIGSREASCSMSNSKYPRQRFANQPSPQTAVIGSIVVLPCRVINMVGELQWTRDDFGLGDERELVAFKRYQMIGSHEEGDYSLRISPVTLEDDAEFQCQVTGEGMSPDLRSQSAKLTVYVPPERPQILQGPVVTTTQGATVEIVCLSRGGKPAAEIQWLDSGGREFRKGVVYTTILLDDNRRRDARSTLSFVASRAHHQAMISCLASNPAINQPLSTQVRLEVSYPPVVAVEAGAGGYQEGDTATLSCHASANPSKLSYRWYRGGQLVSSDNSTELVVENVSRANNLEDVVCEVSNEVGTARKTIRLTVHYGPNFVREPEDVYAEAGQNVTLHCDVDSTPPATIVWLAQTEQTVVGRGPLLRLQAGPTTVGNYLCIAKVEGFQEISGAVGLFLKGPPGVHAAPQQWGTAGETAVVDCYVTAASPRSVLVTWSKLGARLDLEPGRFEVAEERTPQGLRHSLLIHRAQPADFGAYNCSVENSFGSAMVQVTLNKTRGVSVLVIIGGLSLCVVAVAAAVVAVMLHGKRAAASQRAAKAVGGGSGGSGGCGGGGEKSGGLHHSPADHSPTASDLKVELETRTGSSLSHSKDTLELDTCWDKDLNKIGGGTRELPLIVSSPNNAPTPPSYHLTTSAASYLYQEGFSRMALKQNGHVLSNGGSLTYGGNYADHSALTSTQKPGVITSGFSSVGLSSGFSTAGPTYSQGPLVTSSQHNIFPNYGDYDISRENIEQSFPTTYSPTRFNNHTVAGGCSTLPLGLHLTSRNNMNGQAPPVPNPPTTSSIGEHITSSTAPACASIPRLGIPVDPSQYIMSPRTQVMQGALATHV